MRTIKHFLILSILLNIISLGWIMSIELGVRDIKAKSIEAERAVFKDSDGAFLAVWRSSKTNSGAIVILDKDEKYSTLISEGVLALQSTTDNNEKFITDVVSSYPVSITSSSKGGTIKLRSEADNYLLLNTGMTSVDPLDILGPQIFLKTKSNSSSIYTDKISRN